MSIDSLLVFARSLSWYLVVVISIAFGVALARLFVKSQHGWYVGQAKRVLARITGFGGDNNGARVLGYLKKINPYVFEELLLTAFQRRGVRIRRNARYSGDGGIDGRVYIDGHSVFVQAKRYQKHIRASDVKDFGLLIDDHRVYGLFIHTGRTGSGARKHTTDRMEILSGQKLVDLVLGKPVRLFGVTV